MQHSWELTAERIRQQLILRQRIVKLRRDSKQSLWRSRPRDNGQLDGVLEQQLVLDGILIKLGLGRFRVRGIPDRHRVERADDLIRAGRYNSAEEREPPSLTPPAIRTLPFPSRVALCWVRAAPIAAVKANVPVPGS